MNLIQKIFNVSNRPRKKYPAPDNTDNGYYLLECWNQYADLPAELLPHVDTIKTRAEWERTGFPVEFNRYGEARKVKIGHRYFSFIKVDAAEKNMAEAIRKGKRITQNPEHIALLIQQGCRPENFLCNNLFNSKMLK